MPVEAIQLIITIGLAFLSILATIMIGQLKAIREDVKKINGRVDDHASRIGILETQRHHEDATLVRFENKIGRMADEIQKIGRACIAVKHLEGE